MALANHKVRHFPNIIELNDFIQNDADINGVISVMADSASGGYVLVFTVA